MRAGAGDEIAAAAIHSEGRLRASHAEREEVIEALKVAFVHGRLAKGEFDRRVGQVFVARTRAELAAVTAGLPADTALPADTGLPAELLRTSAQLASAQLEPPAVRPVRLVAAATAICAGVWMLGFLVPWPTNSEGDPPHTVMLLVFVTSFLYLFVLAMTLWVGGAALIESWLKRRAGRATATNTAAVKTAAIKTAATKTAIKTEGS